VNPESDLVSAINPLVGYTVSSSLILLVNERRMLSRQVRQLTTALRPLAVRSMSTDYHDDHGKSGAQVALEHRSRLSDLPVPEGSWQEYHNKRNTTFNLMLAGGIIAFITTVIIMKQTDTLYLHGQPDLKKIKIEPNKPKST